MQAYRHAPRVIVQRYENAEGDPIVGAEVPSFELECNRVENSSLNPSPKLVYFNLVTDEEGAIYLPVYDTVLRATSKSYPKDIPVNYPTLGWFECRGRAGLMPVAATGIIGSAYEKAEASGKNGQVRFGKRVFELRSVRRMGGLEALEALEFPVWPYDFPHAQRFPELAEGEWDCLLCDIGGKEGLPKDFDVVEIRVFDHLTRELICDSDWEKGRESPASPLRERPLPGREEPGAPGPA